MKSIITIIFSLILGCSYLPAQTSIDLILGEIEKNNSSLSAMKKNIEADKIGNKTGVFLQNPEFEFHYLWGNPSAIGNRTDINISQSFDFPTAYGHKNQIANNRNEQLDIEFQIQRKSLLYKVRMILADIIYLNAMQSFYNKRMMDAQSMAISYKNKLDAGETNILEYNNAQLYLLNLKKETATNEINRDALLSELAAFNNGIYLEFTDTAFQYSAIPAEFDPWYEQTLQHIPELNYIKSEIEISHKQQQLSFALSLPKFSAGYMSERIPNVQLQGITAGISIPLWENKNTLKYAKARTIALQGFEKDKKIQVYHQLKTIYTKIISLQNSLNDYQALLQSFDNSQLLDIALEKGEITLIDYILELTVYYDSVNKMLETERDVNKAIVELYQFVQ